MNIGGVHVTLWLGTGVPVPANSQLLEELEKVEVTHNDTGRSGFQLTFRVGRSGPVDVLDYKALIIPQLRPFSRVLIIVTFNALPRVLMDGIITNQELNPGQEPGSASLTVTGEDVSVMMDMEEKSAEHPAQDETIIANKIILSYAQYGLLPLVIPPVVIDPPIPIERTPVQQATDLGYLEEMAGRHGYVFYVSPGPVPLQNTAYWGPPIRVGVPQRALSVNMGSSTNVESIDFQYDSLSPTLSEGKIQDRYTNQSIPVQTFASMRIPLVSMPAWLVNQPNVRKQQYRASGLSAMQAYARAQGVTDASVDNVVTASGSLDAVRYGDLLSPRTIVGLRGAGYMHDGIYYVKSVTHEIEMNQYNQRFTLTREGMGALTPVVIP